MSPCTLMLILAVPSAFILGVLLMAAVAAGHRADAARDYDDA